MKLFRRLNELTNYKYERYLPTSFDDTLSLLEKIDKVIEYLNVLISINNDMATEIEKLRDEFSELKEYLLNGGLESNVIKILNEWYDNGKLAEIINNKVLNNKLDKSDYSKTNVLVDWFISDVVDNDWTIAIEKALNMAASSGCVLFPKNMTIKSNAINIEESVCIDINGCELEIIGDYLFGVTKKINNLTIKNCGGVLNEGDEKQYKKHFLMNYKKNGVHGGNTNEFPQGNTLVHYTIKSLILKNNNFGNSKIAIIGDESTEKIYDNFFGDNGQVSPVPYQLYIYKGDNGHNPIFKEKIYIKNNIFDMNLSSGNKSQIIKLTAGSSAAFITENNFYNKGLAQGFIDVFTGGRKLRFINNNLINVQLHRKQVLGQSAFGVAPVDYGYDLIEGNVFEINSDTTHATLLRMTGSQFSIVNNQIKVGGNGGKSAILFIPSDIETGVLNTKENHAIIVSNNLVNFKEHSTGYSNFLYFADGNENLRGNFITINSNVMVGGSDFMRGYVNNSSIVGNIWLDSRTNGYFSQGNNNVSVGNVSDRQSNFSGSSMGNNSNRLFDIIDVEVETDELNVGNNDVYVLNNRTGEVQFIEKIIGGNEGKEVTFIIDQPRIDFVYSNSDIVLENNVNVSLYRNSTITLIKRGNRWIETNRSLKG